MLQVPNIQEINVDLINQGMDPTNSNNRFYVAYLAARSVLVVNHSWSDSTTFGIKIDTNSVEYKIIRDFTTAACEILPVSY